MEIIYIYEKEGDEARYGSYNVKLYKKIIKIYFLCTISKSNNIM